MDHPAADEVYLRVRDRLPHISLSTVYRNLELLAGEGLIRKIEHGGGQKRFDPVREDHSHFHCRGCGAMEDVPFAMSTPDLDPSDPWVRSRVIEGGRTDYFGLCPACAEKGQAGTVEGAAEQSEDS